MPGLRKNFDDEEGPVPVLSRKKGRRLAITSGGDEYDTTGSMPGLEAVSNTSEEDDDEHTDTADSMPDLQEVSNSDEYTSEEDDDEDKEDEEDGDYEDRIREMVDEAKYIADIFDAGDNIPSEFDHFLQEDRKGNPFLKLLGSLRGSYLSKRLRF